MNFKILETSVGFPDVLVYRAIDDYGDDMVKVVAVGIIEGESDQFIEQCLSFESGDEAKDFVRDFSLQSAENFCKKHNISYES